MLTLEKVLFLKGVPMLSRLDGEELAAVAALAEVVAVDAGSALLRQGEPGAWLWVIVAGAVRVEVAGLGVVNRLGPRDHLGEMSVVAGRPASATCVAETAVTALRIEGDAFLELLEERGVVAVGVVRALVDRLLRAEERAREAADAARASKGAES